MHDTMLNDILKDSIQQLKGPKSNTRFFIQVSVVPTDDSFDRDDIQKRIEDLNGYMEFQFGQRIEGALKAYGERLSGEFFLRLQSSSFFEQYTFMMKEVLDNLNARVAVRADVEQLVGTIRSLAGTQDKRAIDTGNVFLTVCSFENTPDYSFDVRSIHLMSEIEERLKGKEKE